MVAGGLRQVELGQDALHVLLDRSDGQHERLRNAGVGAALGHQPEDLAFARREPLERTVLTPPGEQLGDDVGVECGAAAGDPANRLEEVGHMHHAVLEQVADAAPAIGQQLRGVGRLDVLGDHEYSGAGHLAAHLERRAQALVVKRRRQADVNHGEVGPSSDDFAHQGVAVTDGRHHVDFVVSQQAGQSVPQQHVVFRDHYSHGN
jgi:hypothetical protein